MTVVMVIIGPIDGQKRACKNYFVVLLFGVLLWKWSWAEQIFWIFCPSSKCLELTVVNEI
jgi:hypothetical protein